METPDQPTITQTQPPPGADNLQHRRIRVSKFVTLGTETWFNVTISALMFVLGLVAMPYTITLNMDPSVLYPRALLGIYASGVALNILDALVQARSRTSRPLSARWRGQGTTAVYNFLLDTAYTIGIVVFDTRDEEPIVLFLFLLVGVRYLAQVAGRPWPTIANRPIPIAFLPAILPVVLLALQPYDTPYGHPLGSTIVSDIVFITLTLSMAYALFAKVNYWLSEEASLEQALAERDRMLKESEVSAELDAQRLAQQVLRLDLLQDCIRAINSAVELDDLLLMIVNNAVRVLKAEQSSIGLVDPATGELVIQCATGLDSASLRRRRFAPGIGVAGWVVQNGKPLIVNDVRLDVRYVDPYRDDSIGRTTRSMLCVPLVAEEKVIGTLQVTHSEPAALNLDDQSLLATFAEQAALAVHKSQLLDERTRQGEELRRQSELISGIHSIGQSVLASLDLQEVLDTTNSRMSELLSFDRALIYLLNERTGEHELLASSGEGFHDQPSREIELAPGTIAQQLWETALTSASVESYYQPPLPHPDEAADTYYSATQEKAVDTQYSEDNTPIPQSAFRIPQTTDFTNHQPPTTSYSESLALLCLPFINRGRPIGCIILARHSSASFTEVEQDTAEKVAHAATIAILNARLFSRVSVGQQQTAALYRLMLKVNTAPNRRQLALVICQELRQIIGANSAALLINDTTGRTTPWATSGAWQRYDLSSISLPAQGDPFVSGVLLALHQMDTPGLLIIHNIPHDLAQLTGAAGCFTIPLAQSGRIYGLLIIEPGPLQTIPEEIRETISLAISHSTVALERSELFEQTLSAARQSSMLYSIAAEVQTSLEQQTVVQMTVNGVLEALPVNSCEVYLFDDDRQSLRLVGSAISQDTNDTSELVPGHQPPTTNHDSLDIIPVHDNPVLVQVLRSPGLTTGDIYTPDLSPIEDSKRTTNHQSPTTIHSEPSVLLGRLMGSEEALGILRITTDLPAEEFIHRHATFCQTLLTHSGGALERSRLYTTASSQARMLRQRAQQLTDLLNLGSLSAADVPLASMLPRIAAGIARSLGFAYVRIGELGDGTADLEVRAMSGHNRKASEQFATRALSLESLETLLEAGKPVGSNIEGVYLDEALLARLVPGEHLEEGIDPRQLILMPLKSSGGETEGYILAALRDDTYTPETNERDLLEVLSIFAQRIALIIENHHIYSQLLDSKRKMEAVVLSISDGVIVTDSELSILIHNSLAGRLLGSHTSTGPTTLHLPWLIHNEDLINLLRTCIAESISDSMDVDLRLGRDLRTYQAVVHPIAAPGMGVLGAVLTLRDVTAERATERAKSDFLSIVSHELRTPLNSVMGFLDIILMGKTGPLNELQNDFLSTAKREAVVLQRLINDVLDYSQLQSRMLRLEMAPLNLSSVISRVVSQAIPRMDRDDLTLENNVMPGLLVVGDEIRLEQVFKNLVDNAAKFTDPGGTIRFNCETTPTTVTISVKDNGCGIPPAQLGDVFERFYQAENNSSRQKHQRGLGLGLAICKNIIEAHGGRIWIESELGTGTTVFVELLLFDPESDLYDFDTATGKATLTAPALPQG